MRRLLFLIGGLLAASSGFAMAAPREGLVEATRANIAQQGAPAAAPMIVARRGGARPAFRGGARPNFRPARPAFRPGGAGLRPGLRPGRPGFNPNRPGFRPNRPAFRPNRPGIRPPIYVRPWRARPYYGRVIAGVIIGSIIVAAAAGVPPAPPSSDLCWYWTNSRQTRGNWDYSQ